jgi:hypothetical protein
MRRPLAAISDGSLGGTPGLLRLVRAIPGRCGWAGHRSATTRVALGAMTRLISASPAGLSRQCDTDSEPFHPALSRA